MITFQMIDQTLKMIMCSYGTVLHMQSLARMPSGKFAKKYTRAAGVRRSPGERRGSHIFRHHLATHLAGKGFAQPVISNTLGHSEPTTLSYYLSADMVHLRELALSIEQFPLGKEVFKR